MTEKKKSLAESDLKSLKVGIRSFSAWPYIKFVYMHNYEVYKRLIS